jgi:repressor LexA
MVERERAEDEFDIIPNRVKELRKKRGMTLEQLAEKAGYSTGHIGNIENHKKGFSESSLKQIAKALGVKPSELLDTTAAWREVSVFGVVGPKGVVEPYGNNGRIKKPPRVKIPAALGDSLALVVSGDSLYPRYDDGTILVCPRAASDPAQCVGRECYVVLSDGVGLLRKVEPGNDDGRFNLLIHSQSPTLDAEIVTCRPVQAALPPE